jgi:4-hydroxy-tetrahydrodipicolinate synthase
MPNTLPAKGFQGVWPDVLIPLQADFNIDEAKLSAHLRNLGAKGFENFVLFGQAGEGASFSADEKLSALTHVIAAGVEAPNILLGVQASSFTEIAQFIRKAYDKGVRRFLLPGPMHGQPFSHVALFDYFDQLIKRVNLVGWQLFIHQLGGIQHGADLSEATLVDLRKVYPHIFVGVVDQDTHVNHTVDLIRTFGREISIATCHEPNLAILKPTVCVSSLANIIPTVVQHIIANDFVNNATKVPGMKVAKPDDRVVELMSLIGDYPAIAALKLMLSIHYRIEAWEHVRPPQSKLSTEARQALLAAFKTFNLQANE